jgi:hypothetical protein
MVNLAHSPLLSAGSGGPPDAAASHVAAAQHAAHAAAVKATGVLHHQVLDYKHRPLHELYSAVTSLVDMMQAAVDHSLDKVNRGRTV